MSAIRGAVRQGMAAASPTLLTPEEAAVIARCSIKTVRRAYATGALTAYRRRGSRAVLLDNDDVVSWAQGEMLRPTARTLSALESKPDRRSVAKRAVRADEPSRTRKLARQLRFDLSADALRDRRNATAEPRP